MQASTRYTALIIGLVVLTLGLTACGDSPSRAEFEASQAEIQTLRTELTTANKDSLSRAEFEALEQYLNILRSNQARDNALEAHSIPAVFSVGDAGRNAIGVRNLHRQIELYNDAISLDPAVSLKYPAPDRPNFGGDVSHSVYYFRGIAYWALGGEEMGSWKREGALSNVMTDDDFNRAAELMNLAAKDFDDALRVGGPTFNLYCLRGYTYDLMGSIYERLGKTVEANRELAKASGEYAKAIEMGSASVPECPSDY